MRDAVCSLSLHLVCRTATLTRCCPTGVQIIASKRFMAYSNSRGKSDGKVSLLCLPTLPTHTLFLSVYPPLPITLLSDFPIKSLTFETQQ